MDTSDEDADGGDPVSAGGGASFEDWYRHEYWNIVHSLVLITGKAEVAVDAASEACARALARWERVSVMTSPSGWI
jgi:predicted RNA polymerase sigma factor